MFNYVMSHVASFQMEKIYCLILCKKIVSIEIDFTLPHKNIVIHEITAKLLTLSIKL